MSLFSHKSFLINDWLSRIVRWNSSALATQHYRWMLIGDIIWVMFHFSPIYAMLLWLQQVELSVICTIANMSRKLRTYKYIMCLKTYRNISLMFNYKDSKHMDSLDAGTDGQSFLHPSSPCSVSTHCCNDNRAVRLAC